MKNDREVRGAKKHFTVCPLLASLRLILLILVWHAVLEGEAVAVK